MGWGLTSVDDERAVGFYCRVNGRGCSGHHVGYFFHHRPFAAWDWFVCADAAMSVTRWWDRS